ncbi:hypothetical protein D3C80_1611260 [compost metagenome]
MLGFVHHGVYQVATGNQVIQRLCGVGADALLVIVVGHALSYPPQLPTAIVMVDKRCLPGVFIEIHVALGVDVAHARLEGAFHFPYPVQLVTRQVLVHVPRLEDLVVLELWRRQVIVVVRDVHLLLANQLPVVTIG